MASYLNNSSFSIVWSVLVLLEPDFYLKKLQAVEWGNKY